MAVPLEAYTHATLRNAATESKATTNIYIDYIVLTFECKLLY